MTKKLTTNWSGLNVPIGWDDAERGTELGFRSDGQLVWRKAENEDDDSCYIITDKMRALETLKARHKKELYETEMEDE